MIEKKSWEEFRNAGLLWWINRGLHIFGWAIVVVLERDGRISEIYPARVGFRGFDVESESEGFQTLTKHISENISDLEREVRE